jgi:hypothetical protein
MVGMKMMTKVVSNVSFLPIQLMLNVHQKTQSPHNPRRQPRRKPTHRHLKTIHHPLQKKLQYPKNNLRQQAMKNQKVLHHRPSKTMLQLRRLLNKKRPRQSMMPRSKTMFNQWTIPQLRQRLKQMGTHRSKSTFQQSSRPKP